MTAFYNEIDPYAAQWLRNLIAAGHLAPGTVDERSIADIRSHELEGYTQCHFFAGLGGWGLALRMADWPDDEPVWTGSCPCQPFSAAGKREGFADTRHLWPAWCELIRERRPAIVFGEQVARASQWLALVRSQLETMGYAVGAMPIEAASVGANHRRDRYWFVANAEGERLQPRSRAGEALGTGEPRPIELEGCASLSARGGNGSLADSDSDGGQSRQQASAAARQGNSAGAAGSDAGDADVTRLAVRQSERGDARAQQPSAIGADWWTIEPDVGRVAHGVPARVAKLRALGNAIVPQVAAQFIGAAREALRDCAGR